LKAETAAKISPPPVVDPVVAKPAPVVSKPAPVVETAPVEPVVASNVAEPVPEAVTPPVEDLPADPIESVIEITTPQVAESVDLLAAAPLLKGTTTMTDAIETAKGYAEEAKARFQSAFSDMNEKSKSALEKSSKAFEEFGELAKGNLEAVVESSKIAAKGVETLGQDAAEFGRKSFEKTSATMKSFAAVKTPAEFFQLQSELMSSTMDAFAAEASKNSEALLKLVSDISQPLSNRVSVVTDKMKSLAA